MLNTHGGHSMFILSAYILKRVPMKKNERPLMFSIKYEKPVEGKNFAIALTKEMESQNLSKDDTTAWLKKMQEIFPDFSPSDILNFVALADKGYFVLNDTVLDHEFDQKFTQAFIDVWLSDKVVLSNYNRNY